MNRHGIIVDGALYPSLRAAVALEWPGADTSTKALSDVMRQLKLAGGTAVLVYGGKYRKVTAVPLSAAQRAAIGGKRSLRGNK